MKKYEKPAIEEHAMGATMPLMLSDAEQPGYDGEYLSPGKKGAPDDEDDNGFSEGW